MWWCMTVTCWAVLYKAPEHPWVSNLRESWSKSPWILRESLIAYLIVSCGISMSGLEFPSFCPSLLRIPVCRLIRVERKKISSELHRIPHCLLWVGAKVTLHGMAERGWIHGEGPSDLVLGVENRGHILISGESSCMEVLRTQPSQNQSWEETRQDLTLSPVFPDLRTSSVPTAAATPCWEPTLCPSNKWPHDCPKQPVWHFRCFFLYNCLLCLTPQNWAVTVIPKNLTVRSP